ncbi:MAG: PPOX class probable FMN-dependent enzyme [Candidatus Azotimanducaceae bacterium]|jgi:PPOX class probable FMN-dependent enzyme
MIDLISSISELRDVIGEEIPGLSEKNVDHLDEFGLAFIAACAFVVISTSDSKGRVDTSPKGDAPGFVSVVDDKTLLIPDRPGNKLAYGHQNILENPQVGLLFIIPGTSETLRINGTARLRKDNELLTSMSARGKAALLAIEVTIEECFFHCGKAFIRSGLWKPEDWPEKHPVSFGQMYAKRKNMNNKIAALIDDSIESDYRENL